MMALNYFRTIVFPSIATGAYGYPIEETSLTAINSTISWLNQESNGDNVDLIVFCVHMKEDFSCYHKHLKSLEMSNSALAANKTSRPSRQLKQPLPNQSEKQIRHLADSGRTTKRSRSGERLSRHPFSHLLALTILQAFNEIPFTHAVTQPAHKQQNDNQSYTAS